MDLLDRKDSQPASKSAVFVVAVLLALSGPTWAQETCSVYSRLIAELQKNFAGILGTLDQELSDSEGKYYASRFTMPGVRSKDDCHIKQWTPSDRTTEWEYSCSFQLNGVQGVDLKKEAFDFSNEIAKCTGGKLIRYSDRDSKVIAKTSVFQIQVITDDIDFTLRRARPHEND
jgi:hypothetical protein